MQLFKLLKNAGVALGASFLSLPMQAISVILLARSLGVDQFGAYTFAFEFSFIFSRFAESGLNVLATREISKRPEQAQQYLGNLLFIKLLLSVLFYGGMMWLSSRSDLSPDIVKALWIVGLGMFLQSFTVFLSGIYRAYERQDFEGLLVILQASIFFVLVLLGVFGLEQGQNLTYVIWSLLSSYLAIALLGWFLMVRYLVRPALRFDSQLIRFFLREALPIAIAFALIATYSRVGVLVLQSRSTPTEVGLFTAAFRLMTNLGVVPFVLAGTWLPSLSRTAFVKPAEFRLHGMRLFKMLFLLGIPITVGSTLLAEPIIDLLYGSDYLAATPVLQVLMLATFCFFISFGNKTLLESCHRQTEWTIALAVGLGVCLGCSFWWVPNYGALGAGFATLAANLVVLSITLVRVTSLQVWQPILNALTRITGCGVLMGIGIYFCMPVSWILAAIVGSILYSIGLVLLRIINLKEGLRSLKVIQRKRSQRQSKS